MRLLVISSLKSFESKDRKFLFFIFTFESRDRKLEWVVCDFDKERERRKKMDWVLEIESFRESV